MREVGAAAVLAAAVWVLYGAVRHQFWILDDPFHILFISHHHPADYLFHPKSWQELPFRMYTPLQMLSYEVDLRLFGLAPAWWYTHQLISLGAAAIALYGVARLWLLRVPSALVALLFLAGPTTSEWAQELMLRHYIEGFFAACLSVILFVYAERRQRVSLLGLSALAYLCAALCKEVFVPLPLLLLAVAGDDRRMSRVMWHASAAVIYVAWRRWMLGTFLGGYGWAVELSDYPHLAATLPQKLGHTLTVDLPLVGTALLTLTVAALVITLQKKREAWLVVVAALACALLPILPVSTEMQRRYAVVPWLVAVLVFAIYATTTRRAYFALAIALLFAFVLNRADWRTSEEKILAMSAEARTLLQLGDHDVLAEPHIPPATLGSLVELRRTFLDHASGASWFADRSYLCWHDVQNKRVWHYDAATQKVEPGPTLSAASSRQSCAAIDGVRPLGATFSHRGETLRWKLGPYPGGHYFFLLGDGTDSYEMPREAAFVIGSAAVLSLRVKHVEDEGRATYSPPLRLDFTKGDRFSFSRGVRQRN